MLITTSVLLHVLRSKNPLCNYALFFCSGGNHKCTMPCHEGPCYPCTVTIDKACHCGMTVVSIPCIRQKTAGPPRCRRPCKNKPQCDHPAIQKHACHFGNCPSCDLICGKKLIGCEHSCTQKCHDAVYVKVQAEVSVFSILLS